MTSSTQNPVHTYGTTGFYSASLLVTDALGCQAGASGPITVSTVSASFTSTVPACVLSSIQFTDTSSSVLSPLAGWFWSFGDGATATTQNPSHAYAGGGNFSVGLQVINGAGCFSSTTSSVPVYPSPQASFTMSTPIKAGAYIRFTDTSAGGPISWLWNFGDGMTSTTQNPVHLYCGAGTYAVTLTAASTAGCQSFTTQSIVVSPLVTSPVNVSNNSSSSESPHIVFDSFDTAHVVWFDTLPGNHDVFYSFKPSGGSFTTPVNVSQNPGDSWFDSDLYVDSADNLHLVWQDNSPGEWRVLYSEKPFGSPWSAPTSIYNPTWSSGYPDIVVDNHFIVHAWWTEWVGSNNDTYYSFNNGSGWSSPVNISSNPGASFVPSAVVDAARTLFVLWEDSTPGNYDIFFRMKTEGGAWSSTQNISTNSGSSESPQLAMDSQGRLHAVWQDQTPGNHDIFYALRQTDGTWTPPLNISSNTSESMVPHLAVDGLDNVHVVWYDSLCGPSQIYYVQRSPAGSWSLQENISGTAGNAVQPWIAVDSLGVRHVVWSDDSTGNTEILYRNF